ETGVVQYIQVLDSPGTDYPPRIVSTKNGEAVLTGSMRKLNMNPDENGPPFFLGDPDMYMKYIGYYSANGDLIHAIELTEDGGFPFSPDIVYSPEGFIWIGSNARGDIQSTTNGPVYPKYGFTDFFLGKYSLNPTLTVEEFHRFGYAANDGGNYVHAIDLDQNDNLYIVGSQSSDEIQYDPSGVHPPEPKQAYYNTYLAIYNPNFSLEYVGLRSLQGWHGEINEIQIGKNNDLYIHEDFEWDHDFSYTNEEHKLVHSGDGRRDLALVKYEVEFCFTEDFTVRDTSACDSIIFSNQVYFTSGNAKDTTFLLGCNEIKNYNFIIYPTFEGAPEDVNNCKSFTWNGDTYYQSGLYSKTLSTLNGCDSVVQLNLVIDTIIVATQYESICEENNFFWNKSGLSYNASGLYKTIVSTGECDSSFTLNLAVKPAIKDTTPVFHCGSYTWVETGLEYTSSGYYSKTFSHPETGCDSTITIDLTVHPTYSNTAQTEACESFFWTVSNESYFNDTIVQRTLNSSLGCDSILTLNLSIHPSKRNAHTVTVCSDFYWDKTDSIYTASGLDSVKYQTKHGCDSMVVMNLVVNENFCTTLDTNHCFGLPFTWEFNNQNYNLSGVYRDTLINSYGGDSISILNLTILDTSKTHVSEQSCDSFFWGNTGITYLNSQIDTAFFLNKGGCDSLVILDITIFNSSSEDRISSSCNSSFEWPENGVNYTSSGIYTAMYQNQQGCDSLINLNLTLLPNPETVVLESECNSFTWPENGLTYTETSMDTVVFGAQNGCDSLVILDLTIYKDQQAELNESGCDSYFWSNTNTAYTNSGTYSVSLLSQQGCDSLVTLNLTIFHSNSSTTNTSACNTFTWDANGQNYTQSGTYFATLANSSGCDSNLTLELTVYESFQDHVYQVNCNQSYTWPENNVTYTASGDYTETYTDQNGCDSIYFLHFTNYIDTPVPQPIVSCENYFWDLTQTNYTNSGTYSTTVTNSLGCDSLVTIYLTIHQPTQGEETVSKCLGYSWPTNGQYYNQSGDYSATIQNQFGCDSTVTLKLTIHQKDRTPVTAETCDIYIWNETGKTYTTSGVYEHTLKNQWGCDSTIELTLTIFNSPLTEIPKTACADGYFWANTQKTYTQSGTYHDTLVSNRGCDSVVQLQLTILPQNYSVDQISACEQYLWRANGQTYLQSTSDSVYFQNQFGCDSLAFLDLTIHKGSFTNLSQTACGSFIWGQNGVFYSQSGVYRDTIYNQLGCDSILELNLTVHPISPTTTQNFGACYTFSSPHTGLTYDSTGTYFEVLQASTGCDSIFELHLTIDRDFTNQNTVNVCGEFIWPITRDTLTQTGLYQWNGQTQFGCDSTYLLDLTIDRNYHYYDSVVACESYIWGENGAQYSLSGNYQVMYSTSTACDSIYYLNLTIQKPDTVTALVAACESYYWDKNQITYFQAGVYSFHQSGLGQCDSLFYLDLSFLPTDSTAFSILACANYYWAETNQILESSGRYKQVLSNQFGCDSTLILELTLQQDTVVYDSITSCESYFWTGPDSDLAQSGLYSHTFTTLAGCDSTVHLNLTIHQGGASMMDTLLCNQAYFFEPTNTWLEESGRYEFRIPHATNGCDSTVTINYEMVNTNLHYSMNLEGIFLDPNIEIVSWMFQNGKTSDFVLLPENQPTFLNPQNGNYQVIYTVASCVDTLLLKYDQFNCDPPFYVPNALTPNGDNINDTFFVKLKGCPIQAFSITIFDRWGKEFFTSTNPNFKWQGLINGEQAPPGSYPFKITYQVNENKILAGEYMGSVTILQ
ncbi:MAG: gliding motility-associated-like protein, partial [Luteibaculaceae bacterium]